MCSVYYSIIIPHKNIPELLERCLQSIPLREDLQIIIVDDNSDPNIVDFNHFPGHDRTDVELVFTKEGKGAGYARNIGIEKAIGKWVIFADADDYFNYCFSSILQEYVDSDADVVYFNSCSLDTETYVNSSRAKNINNAHMLQDSDPAKEFYFRFIYGEPWGKFIKRKLLIDNDIECDTTIIHNDTRLSYLVGYYANAISMDRRAIYCVTNRLSSVSKQKNDECYITRLNVFCRKYSFLKEKGIDCFEDYFILSPFIHFKSEKNCLQLNECYKIAESYGVSQSLIQYKIKKEERNRKKTKLIEKIKNALHKFY